jgi:hypothetical protein
LTFFDCTHNKIANPTLLNYLIDRFGQNSVLPQDIPMNIDTYTVTFKDWNETTLKIDAVSYGAIATVPANPSREGYIFTGWDVDFGKITENLVVTAQYAPKTYNAYILTVDGGAGATGSGSYESGESVPISAGTPLVGQQFKNWTTSNGGAFTNANSVTTTFTMPANATTVTANWEAIPPSNYILTVSGGSGAMGSGSYEAGDMVTITAGTPPTGQQFKNWTSTNGGTFTNANSTTTTFTMPANATTVTANWKAIPSSLSTYILTVSGGSGAIGSGSYEAGDIVTITAGTPPTGQQFKNWTASNGGTFADANSATTTFTMPANTTTVTANWEAIPPSKYILTVSGGSGATGSGSYEAGDIVTITAGTPPVGQQFKNWTTSNGGTFANANSVTTTFTMPANATTVIVGWENVPSPSEVTDPPTDPTTNSPMDPATDPAANPPTNPAANPPTNPAANPSTNQATSPATNQATSPATETPIVVPVDLSKVKIQIADMMWTGRQLKTGFTLTVTYDVDGELMKRALRPNVDYIITGFGANKDIGAGNVTVTGKTGGPYIGVASATFRIVPKTPAGLKLKAGKNTLRVTFKKLSAAQEIKTYKIQYRYAKGNKWTDWSSKTLKVKSNGKANTATITLKKLKSKKTYQVRVYAYKGACQGLSTKETEAKVK